MTEDYGPAPLASLERVEWRVDGKPTGDAKDGYRARFVPYIDARDVAALLDQWVGPLHWRSRFEEAVLGGKAAMWGIVSIRDPQTGEWIEKRDVGVPSNFEPAKGMVSDAFKRAGCVQWGVGRNVYELPSIWAPCKVTGSGDTAKAWPNAATMPAIQAELKRQNFETTGGHATGADPTADPETGESPLPTGRQETELVTSEDLAHLKVLMDDLTEEERQRVKAERTEKGLSIRSGQFTVGTLRWITKRASELIEHRESIAQLTEDVEQVAEQAGARADAAPGPLAAQPARAMQRAAEDWAAQMKEQEEARPEAPPERTQADISGQDAVDRATARRKAGGAKLAPKAQRDAVAKKLADQPAEVQEEVFRWAQESGHKLGDDLAADSAAAVTAAIQNAARAHKLKGKGLSRRGQPQPEKAPEPADPEAERRALRRTQWALITGAVEILGVETWDMLREELEGEGIAARGTDVAQLGRVFIQAGAIHDDFVAKMATQYDEIASDFAGRPFEEPAGGGGEAADDMVTGNGTGSLDDVDY